ncbi:MAG: septal ring lytic transglycosylase RlpA family protein [Gallionella sp.]
MSKQVLILTLAALLLSACGTTSNKVDTTASSSSGGGYLAGDGPGDTPDNLDSIPDAVPRNEPLHRYANRPYVALGETYTPLTSIGDYKKRGVASWYGKKFHGQRTSSGEVYDMYAMTAAHPILPLPSYVKVTNISNNKSVIVRVNDRGPFMHNRLIDLSYVAAHKLGIVGAGSGEVEVESIMPPAKMSSIAKSGIVSRPLATSTPAVVPTAVSTTLSDVDSGIYLQLGAFESKENAEIHLEKMREQLGDAGKGLKLTSKDNMTRVHIGPYDNQVEARNNADNLAGKLGFKPMLNLP